MQTITIRNSEKGWALRVSGGNTPLTTDHFSMVKACEECLRRGATMADLDGILQDYKASGVKP